MKKTSIILLWAIVCGFLFPGIGYAGETLGLLIIAHGSPMQQWNAPVLELEQEVEEIVLQAGDNPFQAIRVALMEFNEPSVSTVIGDMEKAGIEKVYAIPLFIAPSGHSVYDVPTILGLYSDKEMLETIKEEGTEIVDTKMKITVGPTLSEGHALSEIMADRVAEWSTTPDSECVVLLSHGDTRFQPIWDAMCMKIGSYICAKTGISKFSYAFAEVGQSFISEGLPVVWGAAEECSRTIVVGLYLSMGVENMAENSILRVGRMKFESNKILAGKDIHFAKRGLLPDRRISEWIVDTAMQWVQSQQGL